MADMDRSFTTVGEVTLEAENAKLRYRVEQLEQELRYASPEVLERPMFLDKPIEIADMRPGHPETVQLVRKARWVTGENSYSVPTMIGRTFEKGSRHLEMTFYAHPLQCKLDVRDQANILGELHRHCLMDLIRMYQGRIG